ncbi:MAG: class B sortase [Clostridiales bacterium]|nr:class B sortase [Clostridiales bacterium]
MKNRIVWIVLSVIMFLASIGLILYYLWGNGYLWKAKKAPAAQTYAEFTYPSIDESQMASITDFTTQNQTEPSDPDATPEPVKPVDIECPVDFDELQLANPEIIGWIYMSSPEISLPILRSHTDDTWYLYRDAVGQYKRGGSLFVEHEYNSHDFSDPVTVIYGHRMNSGAMFGTLQATVSESDYFENDRFIVIFTPGVTKIYQIFATLPSDSDHILYYNDFNADGVFDEYFDALFRETGVDVQLIPEAKPKQGDHVIVLSSCLWGDRSKRYLVFAKQVY